MSKFYLCIILPLLAACATIPEPNQTFNLSEEQYEEIIESFSNHSQKYDGPYNILDVNATILNSQVLEAQTLRQATVFQWDKMKYQSELQSKLDSSKEKTQIFVSFFTPDRKSGDLLRSDTLWKTILRSREKEFQGTVKKVSLLPVEIKSLYPSHNRWATGYILTFNTPFNELEGNQSELVITGPVGTSSLKFNAIDKQTK